MFRHNYLLNIISHLQSSAYLHSSFVIFACLYWKLPRTVVPHYLVSSRDLLSIYQQFVETVSLIYILCGVDQLSKLTFYSHPALLWQILTRKLLINERHLNRSLKYWELEITFVSVNELSLSDNILMFELGSRY